VRRYSEEMTSPTSAGPEKMIYFLFNQMNGDVGKKAEKELNEFIKKS
jgi:hypothetical protein